MCAMAHGTQRHEEPETSSPAVREFHTVWGSFVSENSATTLENGNMTKLSSFCHVPIIFPAYITCHNNHWLNQDFLVLR